MTKMGFFLRNSKVVSHLKTNKCNLLYYRPKKKKNVTVDSEKKLIIFSTHW